MVNTVDNARNNGLMGFFLAVLMLFIDLFIAPLAYTGMNYAHPFSYYISFARASIGFFVPLVLAVIAFFVITSKGMTKQKALLIVSFAFLFVFIMVYGGIAHTAVHLIIPILILITYPREVFTDEDILKSLFFMYLLDFFCNGLLTTGIIGKWTFPFPLPWWLFFTIIVGYKFSPSGAAVWIYWISIIIIIGLLLFYYVQSVSFLNNAKGDVASYRKGIVYFLSESISNAGNVFSSSWNSFYQQTFNQTTSYSGTQEESKQGVFLKATDRGDLKYKESMPVYVSATLEAKTIEKSMNVRISCKTTYEENGEDVEFIGIVDEDNKGTEKGTEITVPVFNGVERNIPCLFENLSAGSYDIEFDAKFDFAADSTQKIYMMDRERMLNDFRVLDDKGAEPTKENILSMIYDIQDTNPESIYTGGPLELAIGTDKVPWDLAEENNVKPLFGLSFKNLWMDGGKIEKVNAIYFKVPKPMTIQKNTCTGIPLEIVNSQDIQENEAGYTVYKLDPKVEDISEEATIGCYIIVDSSALDPTPVTTRYLKAHADYSYVLTEKISIEVESSQLSGEVADVQGRVN
jgi:hypothetical protein